MLEFKIQCLRLSAKQKTFKSIQKHSKTIVNIQKHSENFQKHSTTLFKTLKKKNMLFPLDLGEGF